jgi:hypothetical protein
MWMPWWNSQSTAAAPSEARRVRAWYRDCRGKRIAGPRARRG